MGLDRQSASEATSAAEQNEKTWGAHRTCDWRQQQLRGSQCGDQAAQHGHRHLGRTDKTKRWWTSTSSDSADPAPKSISQLERQAPQRLPEHEPAAATRWASLVTRWGATSQGE